MSAFAKDKQLFKAKKTNPKKMPRAEYEAKCDWLFSKYPVCQICGVNPAVDPHHAKFGAGGKDDRTIIAVCQDPCHYQIHHGTKGVAVSTNELIELGFSNHDEWEDEKDLKWF